LSVFSCPGFLVLSLVTVGSFFYGRSCVRMADIAPLTRQGRHTGGLVFVFCLCLFCVLFVWSCFPVTESCSPGLVWCHRCPSGVGFAAVFVLGLTLSSLPMTSVHTVCKSFESAGPDLLPHPPCYDRLMPPPTPVPGVPTRVLCHLFFRFFSAYVHG